MAVVSTFLNNSVPQLSKAVSHLRKTAAVSSGSASSGDNVQLFTVPAGVNYRLIEGSLSHDATLGASCTVKLQRNRGGTRVDLTAATSAGSASQAKLTVPADLQGGDIIEALVGGANITASANINADLLLSRA